MNGYQYVAVRCVPRVAREEFAAKWTPERLRRAVKLLVTELLRKSPPRPPEDRLMTLVAGIYSPNRD